MADNNTDSQNETFCVGNFSKSKILKELRSHIPKILKILKELSSHIPKILKILKS